MPSPVAVQLAVRERDGKRCSVYSMSDGTLRFLAMLAALLAEDPTRFYFFEEIDNGIHPARQWLLLELIEKQTATRPMQVVTTTHSPGLLTSVNDSTFANTSPRVPPGECVRRDHPTGGRSAQCRESCEHLKVLDGC